MDNGVNRMFKDQLRIVLPKLASELEGDTYNDLSKSQKRWLLLRGAEVALRPSLLEDCFQLTGLYPDTLGVENKFLSTSRCS